MRKNSQKRISGVIDAILVLMLSFGGSYGYYSTNRHNIHSVNSPEYKLRTMQNRPAFLNGRDTISNYGPQLNYSNRTQLQPNFSERGDSMMTMSGGMQQRHRNTLNRRNAQKQICVKCPGEVTSIARQGLDGILVEPPAPVSCTTNLPFSRDLYQIETLFGSQFLFVLPHGKHTLFAKIRNVETGMVEHTCPLKFNVIVRRCQRYRLKNPNLKMFCSTGTIWGSSCAFECHDPDQQLSHHEPIVCSESLEWIGQEPTCQREISDNSVMPQFNGACQIPPSPANGKFSCELNQRANNLVDSHSLASGSICRIHCDRYYSIPYQLRALSVMECQNGIWNTTMMDFCYRQRDQRRHRHAQRHPHHHPSNRLRITHYA